MAGHEVALRRDDPPQTHETALHQEDAAQLLLVGLREDPLLHRVDELVERGQEREEAVDEPVDDAVEGERRLAEVVGAAPVTLARLGESGAVVAPHGHEVALGVEAVDLDDVVLVGRGAVDDQEDEVVVLVELGPLPEVHRVLDRQRVEPEYLAEQPEQLVGRAVQVEPPEALLAGEPLEQRAVDADVLRAAAVDEVGSHPGASFPSHRTAMLRRRS